MERLTSLMAAMAVVLSGAARADTVIVLENLAMPGLSSHILTINADPGGRGARNLLIQCDHGETRVTVQTHGVYDFASELLLRWPQMSEALPAQASVSRHPVGAVIANPIGFATAFALHGEVVIGVDGMSVEGAARFHLSEETMGALFNLALTCGWEDQLPLSAAPERTLSFDIPPEDMSPDDLISALRDLGPAIRAQGRDDAIELLDVILSEDSAY